MTRHERRWKKELRRRVVRAARKRAQSEHYGKIMIHRGNLWDMAKAVVPPPPAPLHNERLTESGVPKGRYKILDSVKKMFRRKV